MKFSELRIPKSIDGLTMKHIKAVELIADWDGKVTNRFMCEIVAAMSNRALTYIMRRCDMRDVAQAFNASMRLIEQLNNSYIKDVKKAVPKYLTVNEKEYELVNLDRPNMSFIIDVEQSDFTKDQVRLACMCYVPKGTIYGDMDEGENLLNPIQDRYQDFKEHFPLVVFMRLNGFFLQKYVRLGSVYMVQVKITKLIRKALSTIGYYRLTSSRKKTI